MRTLNSVCRFRGANKCLSFSCVLTLLVYFGCGSSEKDLTGEVFIVTKGGQSIKLGLVEVGVFTDTVIVPFVQNKIKMAKVEVRRLEPTRESLEKQCNQLKKERDYHYQRSLDNIFSDTYEQRYLRSQERLDKKSEEYRQIANEYLSYFKGSFYVSDLPRPIQSIKTNSDGKFSFRLRSGRYALAGSANRKVGDSTEEYFWLIWVNISDDPLTKVMLSNDNLFETYCNDCVFRTKDLPY